LPPLRLGAGPLRRLLADQLPLGRQRTAEDQPRVQGDDPLHRLQLGRRIDPASITAACTASACTVSRTSWTRMIPAPRRAASSASASEPPSRSPASTAVGSIARMVRLRLAP